MTDLIINWNVALAITAAGCFAYALANLMSIRLVRAEADQDD